MAGGQELLATLLGHAAMELWGDVPREVQEALFETAMKGRYGKREQLTRLLHVCHARTAQPGEACLRREEPWSAARVDASGRVAPRLL